MKRRDGLVSDTKKRMMKMMSDDEYIDGLLIEYVYNYYIFYIVIKNDLLYNKSSVDISLLISDIFLLFRYNPPLFIKLFASEYDLAKPDNLARCVIVETETSSFSIIIQLDLISSFIFHIC